ncbi:pyridoxal phosphate-dependent decarboxylase family protein [Amycolatopsis japonica]|uniref:pyridoxal phosphate-dependent decarboxylase family protein n=1 Tax=Amycolatopsis japonica TaxID=208439 RepID=UPI00366CACD2
MNEPTGWDDLIEAVRPYLDTLIDTQRKPSTRPVLTDDKTFYESSLAPGPVPEVSTPLPELLDEIVSTVLERGYLNGAHPHYFGYFHPRPLPVAVLGDCIASLLNQSPAAWRMGPAAAAMEVRTLAWVADFIGYRGAEGSALPRGIFTSGGTIANVSALKMARDAVLGAEVRENGIAREGTRATVYVSAEAHYSLSRAMDMLGMGRHSLRLVPTDPAGHIRVDALTERIRDDRRAGHRPVAVVGMAGATATGAIDPLAELAAIAAEHDMWFHIDGAAAAVFADLPRTRPAFTGLALADSVTLDPHKWLFLPYGLGCLLVRDPNRLSGSFSEQAHYWSHDSRTDFVYLGPEGARPWKSLGLWLALRHLGREGYEQLLMGNLDVARYLAARVRATDGLELFADPVVPVCCFRAIPQRGVDIDAYNAALHEAVLRRGDVHLTICRPNDEAYLRVAVNNHTTRAEHVDALLDAVLEARTTLGP